MAPSRQKKGARVVGAERHAQSEAYIPVLDKPELNPLGTPEAGIHGRAAPAVIEARLAAQVRAAGAQTAATNSHTSCA